MWGKIMTRIILILMIRIIISFCVKELSGNVSQYTCIDQMKKVQFSVQKKASENIKMTPEELRTVITVL